MRMVISYDVSDDRRRRKVATMLEGCGFRVQYSVFECDLDAEALRALQRRLGPALEAGWGECALLSVVRGVPEAGGGDRAGQWAGAGSGGDCVIRS